jgi:hypothetical protein
MAKAYVPSRAERRRFREMIKRLTPSASVYGDYQQRIARYLGECYLVLPAVAYRGGKPGQLTKLRVVRSELFAREYLLAYADPAWFREVWHDCDAVASVVGSPGRDCRAPPLVLAPSNRVRSRSKAFHSIIEHEFVHVNQMLLGTFPEPLKGPRAGDMIENFSLQVRAEYEANVLQLTHWPGVFPQNVGVSLDHWCVLRGYSQALEQMFADMSALAVPPREVVRALELLKTAIPKAFARLGTDTDMVPWFLERFESHVGIALTNVLKAMPDVKKNESFVAAAKWLRGVLTCQGQNGQPHHGPVDRVGPLDINVP